MKPSEASWKPPANYLLLCNYYYLCSEPVREDVSYNRAFLQQPISVQQAVASSRAPRKKAFDA